MHLRLVGDSSVQLRKKVFKQYIRHTVYKVCVIYKKGNILGIWNGLIQFALFVMGEKD